MKPLYKIIALVIAISVFSCKKTIEFDSDYSYPKLVVNSVLEPGTTPTVFITKSTRVSFGDKARFAEIKNAEIFLYEDENKVGKFNYVSPSNVEDDNNKGSKYIINDYKIKENKTYSISVNHSPTEKALAKTKIPKKIKITDVKIKLDSVIEERGKIYFAVAKVTFNSPEEISFFNIECTDIYWGNPEYRMDVENGNSVKKATGTIMVTHQKGSYVSSDFQIDPLIKTKQNEIFSESKNHFHTFNNDLIKGKSYTLKFVIAQGHQAQYLRKTIPDGGFLRAKIKLSHLNKDLFLYYKSLSAFYDNRENYFGEPVIVYTNIENGIGIFASENPNTRTSIHGVYPMDGKRYEYR